MTPASGAGGQAWGGGEPRSLPSLVRTLGSLRAKQERMKAGARLTRRADEPARRSKSLPEMELSITPGVIERRAPSGKGRPPRDGHRTKARIPKARRCQHATAKCGIGELPRATRATQLVSQAAHEEQQEGERERRGVFSTTRAKLLLR